MRSSRRKSGLWRVEHSRSSKHRLVEIDLLQCPHVAFSYNWNFHGAIPAPGSVQSLNEQFNTPGLFLITLSINTDCCGPSPEDSIYLAVTPDPLAVGSGDVTICAGEPTILSLSGLNATDSVVWAPLTSVISQSNAQITVEPNSTIQYVATVYTQTFIDG